MAGTTVKSDRDVGKYMILYSYWKTNAASDKYGTENTAFKMSNGS